MIRASIVRLFLGLAVLACPVTSHAAYLTRLRSAYNQSPTWGAFFRSLSKPAPQIRYVNNFEAPVSDNQRILGESQADLQANIYDVIPYARQVYNNPNSTSRELDKAQIAVLKMLVDSMNIDEAAKIKASARTLYLNDKWQDLNSRWLQMQADRRIQ